MADSANFDMWLLIIQAIIQVLLIIFTVFLTLYFKNYFCRKGIVNGLKLEIIRNLRRVKDLDKSCNDIISEYNGDLEYHLVPFKFIDISRKECEGKGYFNKLDAELVLDIDELYVIFERINDHINEFNKIRDFRDIEVNVVASEQKQIISYMREDIEIVKKIQKTDIISKFIDSA